MVTYLLTTSLAGNAGKRKRVYDTIPTYLHGGGALNVESSCLGLGHGVWIKGLILGHVSAATTEPGTLPFLTVLGSYSYPCNGKERSFP